MVRHVERKALQIHNMYVVVIEGRKNLLHSLYAVDTLYGIGRPPVWTISTANS
jgi:hypothetical protein